MGDSAASGVLMAVRIYFVARGTGVDEHNRQQIQDIRLEAGSREEAYNLLYRMIANSPASLRLSWGIEATSVTSAGGPLPGDGYDIV